MITRAEYARSNDLHDCNDAVCNVSWDGYDRSTGLPALGRIAPVQVLEVIRAGVVRVIS